MTAHPIPDAALASHLAILGKTGAGKSYAARSTVERVLARGERACIVDPTGVWWGLRLAADGKRASRFPVVIAGGRHGDVSLLPEHGPALAKVIGTSATPVILDTSGLTVSDRTRLFTGFAEALLVENVGSLHLVLDEAHLFAPQTRVPDPASAMMVHAANSLVALGRARGLRVALLTQRPAKLHKDSLTQVETLVAMRLVAPQDRKAVEDWIGDQADKKEGAAIIASLPGLPRGEAWVWAPDQGVLERAAFPRIATFDSMAGPESGAERRALPPIDVAAIRAALAIPGQDEAPIRDNGSRTSRPGKDEIAAAEQCGYERAVVEGERRWRASALAALDEIEAAAIDLVAAIKHRRGVLAGPADAIPSIEAARGALAAPAPRPSRSTKQAPERTRDPASGTLNSAARKLLAVLDTNPPVRRSWTQVATLAGLRARGGHFNAGRKALLDAGLVVADGDLVRIAAPSAGAVPEAIDTAALIETWAANLSGAAPRILRHLAGAVHDTRAGIADALALQPRGGHWNAAWKELRDNALIVEAGETVRLAPLFQAAE